jgi:hypothetical protein
MNRFAPQSHANTWHTVKKPRVWHPGTRVVGFVHPNGRAFAKWHFTTYEYEANPHWTTIARKYPGVLIKNEWNEGGGIIYPRYTVKCDDGKIRKFQYIRKETT